MEVGVELVEYGFWMLTSIHFIYSVLSTYCRCPLSCLSAATNASFIVVIKVIYAALQEHDAVVNRIEEGT